LHPGDDTFVTFTVRGIDKIYPVTRSLGSGLTIKAEDIVSGWLPDENSNEVWGRPVGLLVAADGSLLITDDGAKKIWRVSYGK
jgi:glucose/arabinose dehydrogenase